MTTLTGDHGTARYGGEHWSVRHPVTTTIAIIALAIVCGALIGLLIEAVQSGPATASQHRGGAHTRAETLVAAQATVGVAAVTEQAAAPAGGGHTVAVVKRSPARSGFATGRGIVQTGVPPASPQ